MPDGRREASGLGHGGNLHCRPWACGAEPRYASM
jgi:hypothetical protein